MAAQQPARRNSSPSKSSDVFKLDAQGRVLDSYHFGRIPLHNVAATPDGQQLLGVRPLLAAPNGLHPSRTTRVEKCIIVFNMETKAFESQTPVVNDVRDITISKRGGNALVSFERKQSTSTAITDSGEVARHAAQLRGAAKSRVLKAAAVPLPALDDTALLWKRHAPTYRILGADIDILSSRPKPSNEGKIKAQTTIDTMVNWESDACSAKFCDEKGQLLAAYFAKRIERRSAGQRRVGKKAPIYPSGPKAPVLIDGIKDDLVDDALFATQVLHHFCHPEKSQKDGRHDFEDFLMRYRRRPDMKRRMNARKRRKSGILIMMGLPIAVTSEGTAIHKGLITGESSTHGGGKKWEEKDVQGLTRLRDNFVAQLQELNRSKPRGKADENVIAEITRLESAIAVVRDDLVRSCYRWHYNSLIVLYSSTCKSRYNGIREELKYVKRELKKLSPELKKVHDPRGWSGYVAL
ncbi:hypothetical protein F4604DRAFT_1947703 [Suillus subluteus]|nr:hypothetical protein F4604DRAFT_1947703 [Suillus subluteus]